MHFQREDGSALSRTRAVCRFATGQAATRANGESGCAGLLTKCQAEGTYKREMPQREAGQTTTGGKSTHLSLRTGGRSSPRGRVLPRLLSDAAPGSAWCWHRVAHLSHWALNNDGVSGAPRALGQRPRPLRRQTGLDPRGSVSHVTPDSSSRTFSPTGF